MDEYTMGTRLVQQRAGKRPCRAAALARRAVTLIELVIVILTIGIVVMAAMPKFQSAVNRARVDMAASRVARDLTFVRRQALSGSTTGSVAFTSTSDNYTVSGVTGIDRTTIGYSVNLGQDPYQVDLISANFGGGSTVSFDQYARPSSGGSVVVGIGSYQRTILVNASSGRASVP